MDKETTPRFVDGEMTRGEREPGYENNLVVYCYEDDLAVLRCGHDLGVFG